MNTTSAEALIMMVIIFLCVVYWRRHQRMQMLHKMYAEYEQLHKRKHAIATYQLLLAEEEKDFQARLAAAENDIERGKVQVYRSWQARYKHYSASVNNLGEGYFRIVTIRGARADQLALPIQRLHCIERVEVVEDDLRVTIKPNMGAPIDIYRIVMYVVRQRFMELEIEEQYRQQTDDAATRYKEQQDAAVQRVREIEDDQRTAYYNGPLFNPEAWPTPPYPEEKAPSAD